MTDRTVIILAALAAACVGASMVWHPERYYVAPGRKTPDQSVEPPKGFRIILRIVGGLCMVSGAGLLGLLFFR